MLSEEPISVMLLLLALATFLLAFLHEDKGWKSVGLLFSMALFAYFVAGPMDLLLEALFRSGRSCDYFEVFTLRASVRRPCVPHTAALGHGFLLAGLLRLLIVTFGAVRASR